MLPKLHSRCQGSGNKTQLDSFVVTSAGTILFLCFNSLVIYRPLTGRRNGIQNFSLGKKKNQQQLIFELVQYTPNLINPLVRPLGLPEAGRRKLSCQVGAVQGT